MTSSRARILVPVVSSFFVAVALIGYGCGSSSTPGGGGGTTGSAGTHGGGGTTGSGGATGNAVVICQQTCDKALTLCFADAGAFGDTVKATCNASCASSVSSGTTCTNSAEVSAAYQACLAKTTCTDFEACAGNVPGCIGSTGGAGTSGGAGTTGSAGTIGTGGTTGSTGTCADLLACCAAVSNPTLKAACMSGYTQVMPGGDAACGTLFTGIKPTYCP